MFASHDFRMVLKLSGKWEKIWKNLDNFDTIGKWEMIWKNPNSFETVQKMGNDLEKSGQIIRFFCYTRKKFPGSNATVQHWIKLLLQTLPTLSTFSNIINIASHVTIKHC